MIITKRIPIEFITGKITCTLLGILILTFIKRVVNNGIVPQYYVQNSHEAIIPRELYM